MERLDSRFYEVTTIAAGQNMIREWTDLYGYGYGYGYGDGDVDGYYTLLVLVLKKHMESWQKIKLRWELQEDLVVTLVMQLDHLLRW
jgi:hypothetical protein